MLLIYGQSLSSLENGPVWEVTFQSRKWFDISDEKSFSSLKNGPGWAVHFQFGKWFEIFDRHAFSSSENGPYWAVIFVMKMTVRYGPFSELENSYLLEISNHFPNYKGTTHPGPFYELENDCP